MNYKKINISKLGLGLSIVLIMGGLFYWFQFRPAQIKHDCSWVKQISWAKPAEPAMTEAQLKLKGMLEDCSKWDFIKTRPNSSLSGLQDYCESDNKRKVEEYKNGKPEVPAKEWWRKAKTEEYQFCLHDKGL